MHLQDKIYGEHFVDEPVVREILSSYAFARLQRIQQYGIPQEYYPVEGYTRYEHSIGVFLLLRHLKASLTEQIAGLTHDISHTAFSHVTDGIFGRSHLDNAQDARHRSFIMRSEIPGILYMHDIDMEKVSDMERHLLLDREPPDLCADR